MATYLVTGVAGFIASRVAHLLLDKGHAVVGVDNLNDYYDVRLKDWRLAKLLNMVHIVPRSPLSKSAFSGLRHSAPKDGQKFAFQHLDIENFEEVSLLFARFKFDAVLNLAARAGVRYSLENPRAYLATNTTGAVNIMDAMRAHGVTKLVLASTSSLYADCPAPFREDHPVNAPLSPYSATKRAAELMAYTYHKSYGLDVTIVRYFTVFGPAGRPDMAPFRFIKWIEAGTPITLYGDGNQTRDFTYIDDVAAGTIAALKPLGYEIVNIGGGRSPVTLRSVINFIEDALGRRAVICEKPAHAADMKETWADIGKARDLLAWEPRTNVGEGILRAAEWYRENIDWAKSLEV